MTRLGSSGVIPRVGRTRCTKRLGAALEHAPTPSRQDRNGKPMGIGVDPTGLVLLFDSYGYVALAALLLLAAAGMPLPVPVAATFIVLGTLTAHSSGPSFLALALVATLAATAGHSLDYWLGRSSSPLLERWRERWRRRLEARRRRSALLVRVEKRLLQNASLVILVTRCLLTPLASPVSLLAGAASIAFPLYLLLELAGTALYFSGYLALGRLVGPALTREPLTLVLFYGLLILVIALPSLFLWLRPGQLRVGKRSSASEF